MKRGHHATGWIGSVLLALLLGGCATYYPAGPDRGVYFEAPQYRSARITYIDPLVYPYWSLDYFYYSRYYHPYSVVVHRYDPWYYPYPGWYYGYRPGPHFAANRGRFHVPWYRFPDRYAAYHPWRPGTRLSFGYSSRGRHAQRQEPRERLREIDTRLRDIESRRALTVRDQRPDHRRRPGVDRRAPATGRGVADVRSDRTRPSLPTRGADAGRRGTNERASLLQRLREGIRRAGLSERRERLHEPSGEPRPRNRGNRQRPPAIEPGSAGRRRSDAPSPPRDRPQRRPTREPSRSRPTSRQRGDRSDRRERR